MHITSRFTIAVHIITCIEYFKNMKAVTSKFLAESVGSNPVTIRTVMSKLKDAGIITISQGKSGISLSKKLSDITFFDIYKAIDCIDDTGLFHFHENPNMECPVGRNIHEAMDKRLQEIQTSMEEQMKKITIEDIVNDVRRKMNWAQ